MAQAVHETAGRITKQSSDAAATATLCGRRGAGVCCVSVVRLIDECVPADNLEFNRRGVQYLDAHRQTGHVPLLF